MLRILLACVTMGRKENANDVLQRILILDSDQANNVISPELDSSIQPFHLLHFFCCSYIFGLLIIKHWKLNL